LNYTRNGICRNRFNIITQLKGFVKCFLEKNLFFSIFFIL